MTNLDLLSRGEFIKRLTTFAKRYGDGPKDVDRVLSIWVDTEHLVPGPRPKGRRRGQNPEWLWDCRSYRAALRVWRIRSLGAGRYDQVRIEMWLRHCDIRFAEFVRSLENEFRRLRRTFERKITTSFDPRDGNRASAKASRNIVQAMAGNLRDDPAFASNIAANAVDLFDVVRFGGSDTGGALIGLLTATLDESVPQDWRSDIGRFLDQSFRGLLGDMGEIANSTEAFFVRPDEAICQDARRFSNSFRWLSTQTPNLVSLLADSIAAEMLPLVPMFKLLSMMPHFGFPRLRAFICFVNLMRRNRDWHNYANWLSERFVPALQKMVARARGSAEIRKLLGTSNPLAVLLLFNRNALFNRELPPSDKLRLLELLQRNGLEEFESAMRDRPNY